MRAYFYISPGMFNRILFTRAFHYVEFNSTRTFQPFLLLNNVFNKLLEDIRQGKPVLVMDDFDHENEADLIIAAETLTVETMARMIRDGSGIVCLCPDRRVGRSSELPPMVVDNSSQFKTAFTVTIEAAQGVTTRCFC